MKKQTPSFGHRSLPAILLLILLVFIWVCVATNGKHKTDTPAPPEFSKESGFYEEPFSLYVRVRPFTSVYYTTDGSDPKESGKRLRLRIRIEDASQNDNYFAAQPVYLGYEPPGYPVDKITVIRAVSVNRLSGQTSETVTLSFFVGFDEKQIYNGLPVMSLVTDPDNLFGYENGIYTMGKEYDRYKAEGGFTGLPDEEIPDHYVDENGVTHWRYETINSSLRGKSSEREAVVQFFDETHALCFTQTIGIRIAGESSRSAFQKSFNLYARPSYDGNDTFPYPFFGRDDISKLRLRRGDNELIFQEAFLQMLADGTGVAVQHSIPCVLFLDGEYWGIYNLQEQYDDSYFRHYFQVEQDALWHIKNNVAERGGEDAKSSYNALVDQIVLTDVSNDALYDIITDMADVENLAEYFCILLYLDNEDITPTHNQELWRMAPGEEGGVFSDGRWRYLLYDLDATCNDVNADTYADYFEKGERMLLTDLLLANAQFADLYARTMTELMTDTFSYDRVHPLLLEWKERYGAQAVSTARRFYDDSFSEDDYEAAFERLDSFFKYRGDFVKERFLSYSGGS